MKTAKRKNQPAKKTTAPTIATVLVLRTCDANLKSYEGFQWRASGTVSAPDWKPTKQCGNGLHGLLWGEGDGGHLDFDPSSKWLVARVVAADVIDLVGKVKFPRCEVVYCGDRAGATEYISENGAQGKSIVGGTATAGYSGTATAGYRGTATAGDRGTAAAGDSGTATAGYSGTATAGDRGTATAGYSGTATAGYRGTATAGDSGTATAGYSGTATAGDRGTIQIKYYDSGCSRYRIVTGYVGEGGILPNTKYRLQDMKLVKAE